MLKPSLSNIDSHWGTTIDAVELSIQDFYNSVEEKVKARNIPDVRIKRVEWHESGILSDKRMYLEIRRFDCIYHICGAPFGGTFFVSSWLFRQPSQLMAVLSYLPFVFILDYLYQKLIRPETLFFADTMGMFKGAVDAALTAAVDEVVEAQGGRKLPEFERKPILRALASAR